MAVSGGADSVFLLCILHGLFPSQNLTVLHFDHNTRAGASSADAEWVARLCRELKIECRIGRRQKGDDLSENALRKERYAFFSQEAAAGNSQLPPVLFTGHHLDDALENFLIRAARGAGLNGLVAPRELRRWKNGWLSRPLLNLSSEFIRNALSVAGIPWREDVSNHSGEYLRNRLRLSVIPEWKAVAGRNLLAGYRRTRLLLREDADALEAWVDEQMAAIPHWPERIRTARGRPAGFVRRIILRWLIEHCPQIEPPSSVIDGLVEMLGNGGEACSFPFGEGAIHYDGDGELRFVSAADALSDRASAFRFAVVPPGCVYFPDGRVLRIEIRTVSPEFVAREIPRTDIAREVWMPMHGLLIVRNWQAGDRYQPFGMTGTRKVQDCFVDRKVPARERNRRPVVCTSNDSPLWILGLPPAEACRMNAVAAEVLWLTYEQL